MTMTLGDLLEMVRQDYVDQFMAAAEDLNAKSPVLEYEPIVAEADGNVKIEGMLELPIRADLVVDDGKGGKRQVRVEPEGIFRFDDAIKFDWEGMELEVYPFSWDMVPLVLHGVPEECDWEPVRQWFFRWFDEPEEGLEGPLREVVHHLSDPERKDGVVRILADLGSAPLEAWQDLLDACLACKTKKLVLGTKQAD